MASDLSSGCTDAIEVLDEREEGEISLEDVSSSEEGHPNYGYGIRATRCIHCHSIQHCAPWCTSAKYYHPKNSSRKDAVQEKENRHYAKDSGSMGVKHAASTLQEKNDDLVPISSDSDMEIVGLMDKSKQILIRSISRSRCKKKKKKKRTHAAALRAEDFVSPSDPDITATETTLKHDNDNMKGERLIRSHHRELSPIRSHVRSRGNTKSPSRRHRTSAWIQSPIRKSRSPIMRSRSPMLRRSPRRLRSPKRSPYQSPSRTIPKKVFKREQSPLNTCVDIHGNVDKLLKKVRHLDSVGIHAQEENARIREHSSSLKEKLSNMMKGMSDNNGNVTNCAKEKTITHVETNNDADDEEDLALLRQKALETKQKRVDKSNEQTKSESENKTTVYNDDDHDEEDLELRMIALRSAVLKKHQNRVQRGVKSKKHANSTISRSESPFTQSFLDSIPIPNESRVDSPPCMYTSASNENIHTEDMELDTDVEREKEKLPYSPTDNITIDIPIDTELLGIQPSDVSFINLNRRVNSPPFDNTSIQLEDRTLRTGIIENQSFLPNIMSCTDTETTFYETNADAPYSPSDSIETSKSDIASTKHSGTSICTPHFNSTHCSMMNDVPGVNGICTAMDIAMGQERPYSPTDAPIYDPDLSQSLPLMQTLHSSNNSYIMPIETMYDTSYEKSNIVNIHEKSQLQYPMHQINMSENRHINEAKNIVIRTETNSPRFSEAGSVSPNDSMITIDDLLDTDIDPSPPESVSQNIENTENTLNSLTHKITKLAEEPLYMQGVPDVTKDVNKIPTLINRTLVPAPILKSNKQLQQPLPAKKHENQVEPTFKSAEMQPVSIDFNTNVKSSTQFKPMKLTPVTKKSQTILTTPIAFQGCLNDDTTNKTSEDITVPLSKEEDDTACSKNISVSPDKAVVANNTDSVGKKRKRKRRGGRKRNNNLTEIINNRTSNTSIEGSMHNSSVLETEETNTNTISVSAESHCSNIHEKQDNISRPASIDSSNTKLIQSDQNNKSTLLYDKNCMKNKTPAPSNEVQKHDIAQQPTTIKANDNSCPEVVDTKKSTMSRRPSLDEDEDALRAILLASLAKRTKSSDVSSNNTPPVTVTATISNVTASTVQSMQKAPMVTTTPLLSTHQTAQNDVKSHSLTQSTIPYNFGDEKHHHAYAMPLATDVLKGHTAAISTDAVSASPLINPIRKRQLPMPKGPTRKYVKKVSIPASTKVVNNAKKYQNTVVQRKLILQKAASIYNSEKVKDIKTVSNIKTCENKWTSNTKAISSDTPRIVINLESDTESDSEHERLKANSTSASNSKQMEKRQILTIPTTDFEKSVEQFLRYVRKKHETAAASKQTVPTHNAIKNSSASISSVENKISPSVHTPLAVRHLPVSKQEEYRRLKQQILEREILKLQRSVESGTSKKINSANITSHSTISDNLSKESQQSLKEDQNIIPKVQDLNSQISVKNSNDESTETKRNTNTLKSSIIPTSAEKDLASNNTGKRSNATSHSKTGSLQVTPQLNVRISNEIALNQNNRKTNTMENNITALDAKSKLKNISLQDTKRPKTVDASLKVLTTDEVNHKFVQIQVKPNEAGRVVTINKTNLSEKPELGHCMKHNEEKESNEINENKENNIDVAPKEDQTKQQNEINKTNNCIYSRISVEQNERERNIREEEIVPNDINNLDRLNVNLSIEDKNVQSEKATETDRQVIPSVQDETHDQTSLNVSNLDASSDNDLLPASNNIEESKIANAEEFWESIKKDIKTELNSLIHLPRIEQERHLMDKEHKLVMKRYTVLDDLAEMSGDLRQWDMERDLQTTLVEEVKKLREQLKIAEEKLRVHRNRVNNIGPKVMAAHEKINNGRRQCFKLSKICMVLGTKVVGQDYKVPQAAAHLLDNKLKEVANHTRQLSKKKVPSVHISENCMLLEKQTILPTHTEIFQSNLPEDLPIQKETENVEHSQTVQQEDNHNENNNTIVSKDDNVLTSTNIENSSEVQKDKEKDDVHKTNDTVGHDDYCDRIPESELCDGPASLKQDCDIDRCMEAETRILRDVEHPKRIAIEPYVSMLTHLKVPRNANPNGVLCPYELMGTCNDGECQFVHQSASHVL